MIEEFIMADPDFFCAILVYELMLNPGSDTNVTQIQENCATEACRTIKYDTSAEATFSFYFKITSNGKLNNTITESFNVDIVCGAEI
jgi:hypothetical protein